MKKWLAIIAASVMIISSGVGSAKATIQKNNSSKREVSALQSLNKKESKSSSKNKYDDYIQTDTLVLKHSGSISLGLLKRLGGKVITQSKSGFTVIKFTKQENTKKAISEFKKLKNVSSIMPSAKFKATSVQADPKVTEQYYQKMLNIPAAQKKAGKNKVTVAVIDTGIDLKHPELRNKIQSSYNVSNPINATRPADHGTHVAGIIAAEKNNGIGGYGINPNTSILSIDVSDRDEWLSDYNIAQGILYAVQKKAKIINLSLSGPISTPIIDDAIKKASNAGVVIIAAAGNSGGEYREYPAAYEGVISVGAINKDKKLTPWSTYGSTTDLVAPGDNIYSSVYDYEKKSTFASYSGTSMATPMVVGTASLILSKNPKLNADQVEYILKKTATDLGAKGFDSKYGFGLINPLAAMNFDTKKLPILTKDIWNQKTILAKAKLKKGNEFKEKRTFTKPLEQQWVKYTVKKGETYQIHLKESKVFDSKLLVHVYSKDGKKKKTEEIDQVKEGKTEGYFIKIPYDGTLAIGVKDISGNYDLPGGKQSEYELSLQKVTVKKDESDKEHPLVIGKLDYSTKGKDYHLMGEDGDDDYFQFTSGSEGGPVKLELAGTPGADVSMFVYEPSKPENDKGKLEKTSLKEDESDEEEDEDSEPVMEINNKGVGEGEVDVLMTEPNTTYTIMLSNKYLGFDGGLMEIFSMMLGNNAASFFVYEDQFYQSYDPYTFKLSRLNLPADEDGITGDVLSGDMEDEDEWGGDDREVISLLTKQAIPFNLNTYKKGYLQTSEDEDWYKFTATKTGVYAFKLGSSSHASNLYEVESFYGDEDEAELYLNPIASNIDFRTEQASNIMYASIEKGKKYFINIAKNWMDNQFTTNPYKFNATYLAKPEDKYETNNDLKIPAMKSIRVKGDYSKNYDEDLFQYTAKASGNYSIALKNRPPSLKGLPSAVKSNVYSYVVIFDDKNNNKILDFSEYQSAKIINSMYDPTGAYGSHYFKKGKSYIILIAGEVEQLPFSLMQYTLEVKMANDRDEDAKSVVKNNTPSKPLKLKKKSRTKLETIGKFNSFNTKKVDEDWYVVKFDKSFKGEISLSGGKELDGVIEVYQKGKKIAGSDRYSKNDTEVMNVNLKKGTYYIKVKDALGSASLTPYYITLQNK